MGKKKLAATSDDANKPNSSAILRNENKKIKKQVLNGNAYISASYNNTIITITDKKGSVLASSSAGQVGFKGTRKSTPYAATQAAKSIVEKIKKFNLSNLNIYVRGIGQGRDAAIRSLANDGIEINAIIDLTPIPHNGVRPKKERRV